MRVQGLSDYTQDMDLSSLFDRQVDYTPTDEWLSKVPGRGGVYLLTGGQDRLIQLASSADLKRTLRHRLGSEMDTAEPAEGNAGCSTSTLADTAGESSNTSGSSGPANTEETTAGAPASALPKRRRADLREI